MRIQNNNIFYTGSYSILNNNTGSSFPYAMKVNGFGTFGNSGKKSLFHFGTVSITEHMVTAKYSGYSYKVTIYLSDGNEAYDWNIFIINSDNTIRKDPFFYSVTKGKIDNSYIENIVD